MSKSYSQAVKNRLKNFVKKTVPYRIHLQPCGTITPEDLAAREGAAKVNYLRVYEDYETILPLPVELSDNLSTFACYDEVHSHPDGHKYLAYRDSYEVVSVSGGRLSSNNMSNISIITDQNEIVERVSYQYRVDRRASASENDLFQQRYFTEPEYIDGTVATLLAGHGATHNVSHWLYDSIPRIHLLMEAGVFDEIDYFVVPAYNTEYHEYTLGRFGIDKSKIIVGTRDTHLVAKRLVATSHPRGNRSFILPTWVYEFIRSSYLDTQEGGSGKRKRIYISRKDSGYRGIINEAEVEGLLKEYGFESVVLSELSMGDQVTLFSSAEIVVSASGAGLSKLFFAPHDCAVIELFSTGFVHTAFYNVAYLGGLNYKALVTDVDNPASTMAAGQRESFAVDIDKLKTALDGFLS